MLNTLIVFVTSRCLHYIVWNMEMDWRSSYTTCWLKFHQVSQEAPETFKILEIIPFMCSSFWICQLSNAYNPSLTQRNDYTFISDGDAVVFGIFHTFTTVWASILLFLSINITTILLFPSSYHLVATILDEYKDIPQCNTAYSDRVTCFTFSIKLNLYLSVLFNLTCFYCEELISLCTFPLSSHPIVVIAFRCYLSISIVSICSNSQRNDMYLSNFNQWRCIYYEPLFLCASPMSIRIMFCIYLMSSNASILGQV